MKKNIIIYIIVGVCVLGISLTVILTANSKKKNMPNEQIKDAKKCNNIMGGQYKLKFITNSDDSIEDINVCISCYQDPDEKLPIPVKENDTFEGWYYDAKFSKKLDSSKLVSVESSPKKDKDGCTTGYNDITLYAKWSNDDNSLQEEKQENLPKEDKTTKSSKNRIYM